MNHYEYLLGLIDDHPELYAMAERIGDNLYFVKLCAPHHTPTSSGVRCKMIYSMLETRSDAEILARSTNKFMHDRRVKLATARERTEP